ncbi:MAG: hypothetical protein MK052_03895 [Alphaproteobacteria bacterium]|nr:hypothetical protein [Alphaproteobacteria bacterium]
MIKIIYLIMAFSTTAAALLLYIGFGDRLSIKERELIELVESTFLYSDKSMIGMNEINPDDSDVVCLVMNASTVELVLNSLNIQNSSIHWLPNKNAFYSSLLDDGNFIFLKKISNNKIRVELVRFKSRSIDLRTKDKAEFDCMAKEKAFLSASNGSNNLIIKMKSKSD